MPTTKPMTLQGVKTMFRAIDRSAKRAELKRAGWTNKEIETYLNEFMPMDQS